MQRRKQRKDTQGEDTEGTLLARWRRRSGMMSWESVVPGGLHYKAFTETHLDLTFNSRTYPFASKTRPHSTLHSFALGQAGVANYNGWWLKFLSPQQSSPSTPPQLPHNLPLLGAPKIAA